MDDKLIELLIKHTIAVWESEGISYGLTQDEDEELIKLLMLYPGQHTEYLKNNGLM